MMVGYVGGVSSTMDTGCITLKPREGCVKKSPAPYQARNSYIMIYMCVFFLKDGVNSEIIIPASAWIALLQVTSNPMNVSDSSV